MVFRCNYVIIPFDPQNSYKKDSKILIIEYHRGGGGGQNNLTGALVRKIDVAVEHSDNQKTFVFQYNVEIFL